MKKWMLGLSLVLAMTVVSADQALAQTKSQKGKYTAIGAGAGAVTGVVVGHKKGKSALIGGAVGAGAGYLYGRHKDKKAGRKN
jgi:hypothetical protein